MIAGEKPWEASEPPTMARSNPAKRKSGPAATGVNPIMAFRPPPPLRSAIEGYAKDNEVSVSAALRRLVEVGLKAKGKR
jgi:hypothetical protein